MAEPFPMVALTLILAGHPCPDLPLAAGSTWTYRAEVAWAVGADSTAHRSLSWTTTVLAAQSNDSAVAATVEGWPSDLAWWEPGRAPTLSVLYCIRGRVYHLHPTAGTAGALLTALLEGRQRPTTDDLILDLPLHTGKLFGREPGERDDTFYAWFVEAAEPVPPSLRGLRPDLGDSLYSVVYRTNPDYTAVGFVPGLGVARYVYSHHGTTAEADARLVSYRTRGP
jgi:hypothetical protein